LAALGPWWLALLVLGGACVVLAIVWWGIDIVRWLMGQWRKRHASQQPTVSNQDVANLQWAKEVHDRAVRQGLDSLAFARRLLGPPTPAPSREGTPQDMDAPTEMPQVIPEVEISRKRVDERLFVFVTNPGPIAAQFGAEITEMRYSPDPFHFPLPVRWYGSLSALHTIAVRGSNVLEFARIDGDEDAIFFFHPEGRTRVGPLRKDGVGCPFLEVTLRVFAVGSPQDQFMRLDLQLRESDDDHEGRYLLAHQFSRD
jgi:hypothetical protein